MRNSRIPDVANALDEAGHEAFADWFAPGSEADERWQEYERRRGRMYAEALNGPHARNVREFDMRWLEWADAVVMVLPCGKSAFWEAGWAWANGKMVYVLVEEEPDRYDVMLCATAVVSTIEELLAEMPKEIS